MPLTDSGATATLDELEVISEPQRATTVLHPLRLEILRRARRPSSATEIARELGLARQKVNYHVRALAKARFLRRADRRKRRALYEQRWVATAGSYLLAPELMGPLGLDWKHVEDRLSATYLVALAARTVREVGRASREAAAAGRRLATLSMDVELAFESAEQRSRFTEALRDAVAGVVEAHASPVRDRDRDPDQAGEPAPRPYRLVVGCHPVPPEPLPTQAAPRPES